MKQAVYLITLADDLRYTFLQKNNPCQKSRYIYHSLHTDGLDVSRTNIVELKKFYICFKSFYDNVSASASS